MDKLIVVKYGEIALKGKNRSYFEKKLFANIKHALMGLEGYKVIREHGRMYVLCDGAIEDEVIERTRKVFGIVGLCSAEKVENDLELIKANALAQAQRIVDETGMSRFKVEVKRSNKNFDMKSPEIARIVGGNINQNVDGVQVDVHTPEFVVTVEIRDVTYIYSKEVKGFGGLPYGCAGKGMLLLSGGIDSPVAGWMLAKRGMEIEAVHFHSYPFTSDRAQEKIYDLARQLAVYTGYVRVHSINLLEIQKAINEFCPSKEMTILSRRFMMALAERVALETNCQALITGENIGQVASQTIEGLTVTNSRVDLPVLRPLIAFDKLDIIKIAEMIGTFETSILPFEDCCTVFLPDKVVTRPVLADIEKSESNLDVESLIDAAIAGKEIFTFIREK
ncbi:MAG: tRNA 4-thiouridine(8) synthase ThiI [Clostridia bacterium]|nr:tRNA 4-thiouridine(8) synthase ThiI [Clostridia bacterium]